MTKNKLYILLLLFPVSIFGQQEKVEISADSTKIKIGSQFNLTLKTTVDTLSHVVFPEVNNFGRLEVLGSYPIDTIKKNATYELVKRYGLTQFDSGKYTIPSLPILINNKSFLTDSLFIEVSNVVVDTLKQGMYDIKPIIEVPSTNKTIWKYILIFFLVIGVVVALIYWLLKKYRKKKEKEIIYSSPIEKASSLLRSLEQKELWQKGEIKSYYSELTDIARNYIEEALELPAMESTTNELIIGLHSIIIKKKMLLYPETLQNLEHVLKNADLVKFAKSKPLEFEIADDRNRIEKVITILDKSIPEPTEEELALDESKKELRLKEQKQKRIQFIVIVASFLLFIIVGYFVITVGLTNIKDAVFGNSTKDLLEGEWVGSEYGDPSVFVETPKVLSRYVNTNEQSESSTKGSQRFIYGSLLDKFYVSVMTSHFEQKEEVDLESGMDQRIKTFETQYSAKNILVKQEDYDTKQGIAGKKAYGTMTIFDPVKKEEIKMTYQILIFLQDNGIQEIIITSRYDDSYATKISERIINSVELKKTN